MFILLISSNKLNIVILHRLSPTEFYNLNETYEKQVLCFLCGCQIRVTVKGLVEWMPAGMQTGIMIYLFP